MRKNILHKCYFIGKSLLWSGMLYMALMMVLNWDDVRATFNGDHPSIVTGGMPPTYNKPIALPASMPSKISGSFNVLQNAENTLICLAHIFTSIVK